ncbi:hypothetical protein ACOSP7_014286 [Xanthoceras sorbifolium]
MPDGGNGARNSNSEVNEGPIKGKPIEGEFDKARKGLGMPKSNGSHDDGKTSMGKNSLVNSGGSRFNVPHESIEEHNNDREIPRKNVLAEITNTGGRRHRTGSSKYCENSIARTGEYRSSTKLLGILKIGAVIRNKPGLNPS